MVGATVVVEGGHFRGYRVMQPEDPTFLDSLGLKPGDILTARESDAGRERMTDNSRVTRLAFFL
jgi:type II secretory pathway component PulC